MIIGKEKRSHQPVMIYAKVIIETDVRSLLLLSSTSAGKDALL